MRRGICAAVYLRLIIDTRGTAPELVKRLNAYVDKDPSFKEGIAWNAKGDYESYKKLKEEADALEKTLKEAEKYIASTQKELERDREKAKKARDKFLKSFAKKSDPIISAQYVVHVDGNKFTSGSVTATLDGGPWDGKEISLDTPEWQMLVFSD